MDSHTPIRVLTVDDDALVRQAYRELFSSQSEFDLVGEACDGVQAVEAYERFRPDVVLMDLQMPTMNGVEATRAICSKDRGACVVVLTTFGTREHIVAALRAGASGYLLKDTRAEGIVAGIRQAISGDMPLSAAIRRRLVTTLAEQDVIPNAPVDIGLTPREVELLNWLAQGLSNAQIAKQMYLSEGSVKQYLTHIGAKMQVKSRTQILVKSIQLHVVDPHSLPAPHGSVLACKQQS